MLIIRTETTENTPSAEHDLAGTYKFLCNCDEAFLPEDAVLQVNHYWNMHSKDWVQGDSRAQCPECERLSQPLRIAISNSAFRRVEQVYGH